MREPRYGLVARTSERDVRKGLPWHVPCWIVPILTAKEREHHDQSRPAAYGSRTHTCIRTYTTDSRIMLAAPMPRVVRGRSDPPGSKGVATPFDEQLEYLTESDARPRHLCSVDLRIQQF